MKRYILIVILCLVPLSANAIHTQPLGQYVDPPDPATALAAQLVQTVIDQNLPKPVVPDTKISWPELAEKYGDQAIEGVKSLAGKVEELLTKASPTVWRALIMKQYAKAISGLLVPVVFLIALVVWVLAWRKHVFEVNSRGELTENGQGGVAITKYVVPILLACITVGTAVYMSMNYIPYLVAPEWYAINDIVDALQKLLHGSMALPR
jgi:hypothetical protein